MSINSDWKEIKEIVRSRTDVEKQEELEKLINKIEEQDLIALIVALDQQHMAIQDYEDLKGQYDYADGSCGWYPMMSLSEVAEELYDNNSLPDWLKQYVDFDSMGEDLEMDGYRETDGGVIYLG